MSTSTNTTPSDSLYKAVSSQIKINGEVLPVDYEVKEIETLKQVNKLSRAEIVIYGGDHTTNTFEESEDDRFEIGNEVEIQMGYEQQNILVFKGIIEKHRISIRSGFFRDKHKSLLIITCVDKALKLKNSYTSMIFKEKTDQQILTSLLSNVDGLDTTVEETSLVHTLLPKYNVDDWSFILNRSQLNGFLVINTNNSIAIKNPSISSYLSSLTINNGDGTISFDATIDTSDQYQKFTLNNLHPFTEESSEKDASKADDIISNSSSSSEKISPYSSPEEINLAISQEIDSNELKVLADAVLKQKQLHRVSGSAKFKGVLELDLDQIVSLSGFGNRFDGDVYITGITHQISEGQIFTEIDFGLPKSLFKIEQSFDFKTFIHPIEGVHIGKVVQIHDDPENQYRIKVLVPALNETTDGIWARLTQFYTGEASGSFFIPEIGTQVVLSFIANDPRFPVILGSLYSQNQTPDNIPQEENIIKNIVTASNLKIEFNESEKSLKLSTPSGNKISLNENDQEIIIEDQNNNIVKTSSSGIELTSQGDIKINAGGKIELQANSQLNISSSSDVSIDGLNINQNANASLSAKATSNLELSSSGASILKGSIVQIN